MNLSFSFSRLLLELVTEMKTLTPCTRSLQVSRVRVFKAAGRSPAQCQTGSCRQYRSSLAHFGTPIFFCFLPSDRLPPGPPPPGAYQRQQSAFVYFTLKSKRTHVNPWDIYTTGLRLKAIWFDLSNRRFLLLCFFFQSEGCVRYASCGHAGNPPVFCGAHKTIGMVNLIGRRCAVDSCEVCT